MEETLGGMMGALLDKLKRTCPKCRVIDFPKRITGHYADHSRSRIFLWECPLCSHIWKDEKVRPKEPENAKEYAVLRSENWGRVLEQVK